VSYTHKVVLHFILLIEYCDVDYLLLVDQTVD
jgi:hypothetical protein